VGIELGCQQGTDNGSVYQWRPRKQGTGKRRWDVEGLDDGRDLGPHQEVLVKDF